MLSVQPKFAEAIVDGHKTIELRRRRPHVRPGTLGLVYSSSPIQAVVGSFRVEGIYSGTPEDLWVSAESGANLSRRDFESYFAGTDIGHCILLSCGQRLARPIELSHLRNIWPGCKPPQSFGYLVGADSNSRRLMSAIGNHLLNKIGDSKDIYINHTANTGLKGNRGSFILGWREVKALLSILRTWQDTGAQGHDASPS